MFYCLFPITRGCFFNVSSIKLLANENRQPSTERNGVIERRLVGNQTANGTEKANDDKSKIQKEINKESTGES